MSRPILILMDDVHLEGRDLVEQKRFAEEINHQIEEIKKLGNTPIVVCAGDIGEGTAGVEWAAQFKADVIYICGNHEFWNQDFYEVPIKIKDFVNLPQHQHIKFLYNETIVLHGIRFIGSTLWTSIASHLPWVAKNHILKFYAAMGDFKRSTAEKWYTEENKKRLSDFLTTHGVEEERINDLIVNKLFNPLIELDENNIAQQFIENELNKEYKGKTVVVSHHLPVYELWMKKKNMSSYMITGEFINNERQFFEAAKGNDTECRNVLMMGYYANDLKKIMFKKNAPSFWLHGHLHTPMDDIIGRTQIISSPVGYQKQSSEMKFKIIEINNNKQALINYVKKEIEEYDWNNNLLQNLRDLESMIGKFETATNSSLFIPSDFGSILKTYQEKHADNLEKFKNNMKEWLKLFVYDKDPNFTEENVDFYLMAKLSGLTDVKVIQNGMVQVRYKMPELLAAAINENSFVNEEEYKLRNRNNLQYYHYKEWMKELQKIQIQINQFKKILLLLCDRYNKPLDD